MSKIGLIIKREYTTRIRKKSFIIMTILGPILFAGLLFGTIWITLNDQQTYTVLISDPYGLVTEYRGEQDSTLVPRFPDQFKDDEHVIYGFTEKSPNKDEIKEGFYNIMITLDDVTINDGKCQMFYKNFPAENVKEKLKNDLQEALERFRVDDLLKVDYENYKRTKLQVSLNPQDVFATDDKKDIQKCAVVGFIFAIIIYLFIFMYGIQVMRGVLEEKTSRVVEVMVSSVKPFQLMMGKVVGIGLVGLTQFLIWVILSAVLATFGLNYFESHLVNGASVLENGVAVGNGMNQAEMAQSLLNNETINWIFEINWPLMVGMFIFFFIGGFLLYASLFAAIGAAVDSDSDTQQFMLSVTLPLIFSYIVSAMLINNPESSIGNFFSIFPLTSPIIIMVKTAMGNIGEWHLISSMVALIVAFLFFIWLGAKIYRVGILSYGKKVSYKDLWKWIRQSD